METSRIISAARALFGGSPVMVGNNKRRQEIVIACMRGRGHAVAG